MTDNAWIILGLMILLMIAAWVLLRKKRCTEQYDERQLRIRAKGYQIGFFTALFLMSILALLFEAECLTVITPGLAALTALMISVTVFAVYCINHDAFLAIRENGKSQIALYTIIVLVEIANIIRHIVMGELMVNGKVEFTIGSAIVVGLCFLVMLITLLLKIRRDKKEVEE
ncbi:MAG: LPXTG cell wall anchor domain-containing protein [Clostridia bacterium]|nr:LPXTG cell wall anchor domain-containing protein [Clostridia bacterium]